LLRRFAVLLGAPPAVLTVEPREGETRYWGPILKRAAVHFVPIATAVTIVVWLAYAGLLVTSFRTAFQPQTWLAADAAARLDAGATAQSVLPAYRIDLAVSGYPFVMVYDASDQLVASSATLDGREPVLPGGVLDYARSGVERHDGTWYAAYAGDAPWIFWTPRQGASTAVVVQRWSGGYVVAGRSAEAPTAVFAIAWTLALAATAAVCLLIGVLHPLTGPQPSGGGGGGGGPEMGPPPAPRPRQRHSHAFRPPLVRRRRSRPVSPR
jgi:hypothetical protein